MNRYLTLGLMIALGLAGCGGDEDPPVYPTTPGSGGKTGSGGKGGKGGTGGSGGTGGDMQPAGAPVIVITSPEAAEDPNEDDVVTSDEIEVVCTVTQSADEGSAPVDPTSVDIAVLDAEGEVVRELPGSPTGNDGEYAATLAVNDIASGPASFRCSAKDTSKPAITGTGTLPALIDHGPVIDADEPAASSAHPLDGPVAFEFEVAPAELTDDDDEAAVDEVTLTVLDVEIELDEGPSGTYAASVDFNDKLTFPITPSGSVPVVIRATNRRTPNPVTNTYSYDFVIDGSGPTIKVTSHKNNDIVAGKVTVAFSVLDEQSGIDPATVFVTVKSVPYFYDAANGNWSRNGDVFGFTFDTRSLGLDTSQVTLNFGANDRVGNEAQGASLLLSLDNVPPIIDLDPGNVRESRLASGNRVCSNSFDPLGDAPNDLSKVFATILPRVLVWDLTNEAPGQTIFYPALINRDEVRLYLQPDPSKPFLVDKRFNDGICDDLADSAADLPFLHLRAVTPGGSSWYGSQTNGIAPATAEICTTEAGTPNPPNSMCSGNSDLFKVIKHDVESSPPEPAIYASPELTGPTCTGTEWEMTGSTTLVEGWICLAVIAEDSVGNRAASRPLRLCYDDAVDPPPDCSPESAPTCLPAACNVPAPAFDSAILDP